MPGADRARPRAAYPRPAPLELARLCAHVERDSVGARTGLLDQLASLCGEAAHGVLLDFRTLEMGLVPLALGAWRLVVLDSGERHELASSGYNSRREECARACELLGIEHLSEADERALVALPGPLRKRARHVLGEDARVRAAVSALQGGELERSGRCDASHESLRELFEVPTPAVDAAATPLREAGASGARMIGGGFGGSVLGLFPPGMKAPAGTLEVHPAAGARVPPPSPPRAPSRSPPELARAHHHARAEAHPAQGHVLEARLAPVADHPLRRMSLVKAADAASEEVAHLLPLARERPPEQRQADFRAQPPGGPRRRERRDAELDHADGPAGAQNRANARMRRRRIVA